MELTTFHAKRAMEVLPFCRIRGYGTPPILQDQRHGESEAKLLVFSIF
jgi:hypothetical protein